MRLIFHKNFKKQCQKLPFLQRKADERILLFRQDPFHPLLNNHALTGKYKGWRSINITGDCRAVYELVADDIAYFITIDTHSNLYN
jgi:addiction module RelE/StbE family toxin